MCFPWCFCVSRKCGNSKCFRKYIPSFPDGLSRLGHQEEHPSILIETIFFEKFNSMLCQFQPFWFGFNLMIECRQKPNEPPMSPYSLIWINDCPTPTQTKGKTPVLLINTVVYPKRERVIEQSVFMDLKVILKIFTSFHFDKRFKIYIFLQNFEEYRMKETIRINYFY